MRLLLLTLLLATHAAASSRSYRRPAHETHSAGLEGTWPRRRRAAAEGALVRYRSTREHPLAKDVAKLEPARRQRDAEEATEDEMPHQSRQQHLVQKNAADKTKELPAPGNERMGEMNKGHQSTRKLLRKRLPRRTFEKEGSKVEHRHKHGGGKHDRGENGHHVRGDTKKRDEEMEALGADLKGGDGAAKASGDARHEDTEEKSHGGDKKEGEHRHKHDGGKHDVGKNGHHARGDKKKRDGKIEARGADLKGGNGAAKTSGDAKHENNGEEKRHGGEMKDFNDKHAKHRNREERHHGARKKDREKKDEREKISLRAGEANKGSEPKADRKGDDDRKKKGEPTGSPSMSPTERKKRAGVADVTKMGRTKVHHKNKRGGADGSAMSMSMRNADLKGAEKGSKKEKDGDTKRKKAGDAGEDGRGKNGAKENEAEGDETRFVIDFNDEDEDEATSMAAGTAGASGAEAGGAGNATMDDLVADAAAADGAAPDATVADPTTAAATKTVTTKAAKASPHHGREEDPIEPQSSADMKMSMSMSAPPAAAEYKGKSDKAGKVEEAVAEQSIEGAREEEYHSAPANSVEDAEVEGAGEVAATAAAAAAEVAATAAAAAAEKAATKATAAPPAESYGTTTAPDIVTYTEAPEAEMLAQQGQTMRKPDPKPAPPGPAADVSATLREGDESRLRQEVADILLAGAGASVAHSTTHGAAHHSSQYTHHGRQRDDEEGAGAAATDAQAMPLVEDKLSPKTPDYVTSGGGALAPRSGVAVGLCLLASFACVFAKT